MRASRTLAASVAREILQYSLVAFFATSVVLVSQNLLRRMDELTAVGFTLADLGVMLRCLLPMLTVYTIPIAVLLGSVLAIRRQVADSEILAMRACGLGATTLLAPCLAIGASVSLISGWLLIGVEHQARRDLITLFNTVATRGEVVQAGEFRGIGRRVIYVAERHDDDLLGGIMISDRSQDPPFLVFAESGRLSLDAGAARIHLRLARGEMHFESGELEPDRYRRVLFDHFDYSFDVAGLLPEEALPVRPKQMSLAELHEVAARGRAGDPLLELKKREPVLYELEIQRRFALPLAPLLFALAAVPLALMGRGGSRSWGPVACVLLAFAYYAVLTFLQFLARAHWLTPVLAFWIPNALVLLLSIEGLRRSRLRSGP